MTTEKNIHRMNPGSDNHPKIDPLIFVVAILIVIVFLI